MDKMKRRISRLFWRIFREPWWDKKTKVQGKVIDPYSYTRGFEDGMKAISSPINMPVMRILSDEELKSLRATWEEVTNSPNIIKVNYTETSNE